MALRTVQMVNGKLDTLQDQILVIDYANESRATLGKLKCELTPFFCLLSVEVWPGT
jgi:hypothetical protein